MVFFNGAIYHLETNLIRKVVLTGTSNGTSTFAGSSTLGYVNGASTAARFDRLRDVVLDSQNNMFTIENPGSNKVIRLVNITDGK